MTLRDRSVFLTASLSRGKFIPKLCTAGMEKFNSWFAMIVYISGFHQNQEMCKQIIYVLKEKKIINSWAFSDSKAKVSLSKTSSFNENRNVALVLEEVLDYQ